MKVHKEKNFNYFLIIYVILFSLSYIALPFFFLRDLYKSEIQLLSSIIVLSFISIYLSGFLFETPQLLRVRVNFFEFAICIFTLFLIGIIVTFLTAPKIPIIESFRGASKEELSVYRELFLKARSGWEAGLAYFNGMLTGAVIPFIIALSFEKGSRYKYFFLFFFFIYSISFLEKAYFLKVLIPVLVVFYLNAKNKKIFSVLALAALFGFLILMALLSGITSDANEIFDLESFFSVQYVNNSPLDMIIWRGIVIPVITALDGLKVFMSEFNSNFFWGATSSLFSFLTGVERINFERELFFSQWGQNETETGNANALYLLEAYINFGFLGVFLFSLFVGSIVKLFNSSKYQSSKGMIILFFFNIFNAGLIGTLLSNGYLFLILIVWVFDFE